MIKKITIVNFRSIQNLSFEVTNLNAIVGPNSVGKTNILKAIDLVLGEGWTTKAKVARELFCNPDIPLYIEIEFSQTITHTNYNNTHQIYKASLEMKLYPGLSCNTKLFEIGTEKEFHLNEEFKKNCHFIYFPSNRDLGSQMRMSNWTLLGKMMKIVYDNYVNIYDSEDALKDTFKDTFKELMVAPKAFLEDDFDDTNITFKKFSNTFNKYCHQNSAGLANSFSPELNIYNLNWFYKTLQISVTEPTHAKSFDCEELGSGMQNLILLSIFQTYAELMGGKVIFGIEEPEIYLYPQAQRSLYKNFQTLSEQSQILYTTHSQNFVDAARAYEVIMLQKKDEGTCCNSRASYMNKMAAEKFRFKIYTQFNTERNELFFAKKVILVEGASEKMMISTICEVKWSLDIDKLGISIIECGGKSGVIYFSGVCKGLGIKDFYGIWDEDGEVKRQDLLSEMIANKNGIELVPNLEIFLNQKFDGLNLSSNSNIKVQQIYDWVISCHPENIPVEFDGLKNFMSNIVKEELDLPF